MNNSYLKRLRNIGLFWAIYILLTTVLSVPFYLFNIPDETVELIFYILAVLFTAAASAVTAYFSSSRGWLNGLVSGVLFLVMLLIFVSLISGFQIDIAAFLLKLPLILVITVIAGIIGINIKR